MKFAIFSDTHDNVPNTEKAIDYIKQQGIALMIHCGDIAAPAMAEFICKNFDGEIHAITGNVSGSPEEIKSKTKDYNFTLYDETGKIEIDGKKIAFNHYPEEAKILAQSGQYDLVFYGHTHTPWEETFGKTKMLNPGTVSGMFSKATFAIYDTEKNKAELIILEKI